MVAMLVKGFFRIFKELLGHSPKKKKAWIIQCYKCADMYGNALYSATATQRHQ